VEIMETRVIRPELKRLVGNESELYPISETPTVEINSAEGAIRETNFIKSEYSHKRVNHITYSNPEFNCDCDITDKNIEIIARGIIWDANMGRLPINYQLGLYERKKYQLGPSKGISKKFQGVSE